MALGFVNLGFETAGTIAGHMSGWTVVFLSAAFQFAAYGDTLETIAYETFEYEWGSNEDGYFEFDVDVDLVYALYDAIPTTYEDFESAWAGGNQIHYSSLPNTILAAYGIAPEDDFEAFENEWDENENDIQAFEVADLTLALYDLGAPENREDYEEEWSSNENDLLAFGPGDTALAEYDGSQDYEDYEEVDLVLYRVEVTATGVDPDEFHVIINGADCQYGYTGVGNTASVRDQVVIAINSQMAGIATAQADGGSKLKIRSVTNGQNLTVSILTTGAAKMVLSYPDRSMYWTQLQEM